MNVPPHLFSLLLGPLLFSTSATDGAGLAPRLLAQDPKPGAAGIGDPYFPLAGNGGYDVQHYDLTLEVDMENGDILGKATVVAVATQDLSSFHLDLHGLEVLRVDVNGKEAEQAREGDELIITPASPLREGDHFSTIIDYYGVPEPVRDASIPIMSGVGWAQRDSGVCVFSECTGAPSWFPCNDHPRDKATYSISVTVAKPWIVAANGVLAEEIDNGKQRTYRWQCNSPMATYLATVNIAKFGMKLEEGPGGIPMRLYYPADSTEAELAEFAHTREIIEHFSELFGPYPFESVGGLISYEPIGGALETQTMPVYGRGMNESVVAHELAHQWFGDCVSVEEWKDLWLNEGFATYADWLWTEHTDGAAGMEREVRRTYRMLRRGRFGPPPDPGLGQLFGPRVYQRGAMVLHALRGEVGDEVFFRILRTWVEEHHNGNASTADFTAHAARIAGRSLDSVFQPWLFDPVIPEVPELEPQSQQQEQ